MVKIKGVFNAKTMNAFATEKLEKTKLHTVKIAVFFYFAGVVLWLVFRHELRHCDVIMA